MIKTRKSTTKAPHHTHHHHSHHGEKSKLYPTPKARSFSSLAIIGGVLGFCLASGLIIPLHGVLNIGPWAIMLLGAILGGLLGAAVSPLFSGLYSADSSLRTGPFALRHDDPVSGHLPAGDNPARGHNRKVTAA
jgi:hypothetical protein